MRLLFKLLMRIGLISSGPAVSSITSSTQIEGTSLVHTVTLASAVAVTEGLYPFSIGGGTATSGTDYTATPTFSAGVTRSGGTLTVPVGVSSFTITVSTTNDTVYEGTETYNISVGGMTNTGTLTDNDSAPTIASVSSASATEGSNIVHTVAVTGVAQAARTFALAFSGAAVGGTDYNSTPTFSNGVTLSGGNITLPPSVTSFTVTVSTINNASVDGSRAYTLSIGTASGTGSISDDETPSPAFTATLTALTNATGTVTTLAYINGGGGGGGTPSDLLDLLATLTAGGSVTGTGGITTATTGIASRTTGVAPMAVFFDATGTTNSLGIDNFADILYLWNFGDSETAWTYGTGVGDNSKNRARGGVAAHVYETAGTYTAKVTPVTVSSLGVLSYGTTTSISITVNAATRSGTTYICSASGDFTGAPAGTQAPAGSNIATLLGSGRLAANTRFLFKGGETFNFPSTVNIGVSGVTFGAWGTGKPTITHTGGVTDGFNLQNGVDDVIVMDWSLDAVTSGSGNVRHKNLFAVTPGTVAGRTNVLMLRVDTNKNSAIYDSGWTDGLFIVDCNGQSFSGGNGNVAVYAEISSRVAILGNRIYDATGVEHCLRTQGSTKIVISNNDIALPANNKSVVTIRGRSNQALTNDKTTWSGVWAEHVVISENNLTSRAGATWTVQFAPQDDADNGPVRDIIFERNFIDSGASTADAVATEGISGITVRNNLIKVGGAYNALLVLYRNIYVTEAPTDTKFYNNTFYRDTAASPTYINPLYMQRDSGAASAAIPTGTVYKNNLFAGPTLSNAVLPGTNCGATADISNSSTAAQIYGTAGGFTVPPVAYADWKAASGYSIDGGTYVPVFDDFFGAARTGTYDMGAVNP